MSAEPIHQSASQAFESLYVLKARRPGILAWIARLLGR
jgi:hypothetical protein